jgi:hypothetical protein
MDVAKVLTLIHSVRGCGPELDVVLPGLSIARYLDRSTSHRGMIVCYLKVVAAIIHVEIAREEYCPMIVAAQIRVVSIAPWRSNVMVLSKPNSTQL